MEPHHRKPLCEALDDVGLYFLQLCNLSTVHLMIHVGCHLHCIFDNGSDMMITVEK